MFKGSRFKIPHYGKHFDTRIIEICVGLRLGSVQKEDLTNSVSFKRCPVSLTWEIITNLISTYVIHMYGAVYFNVVVLYKPIHNLTTLSWS